MQLGRWWLTRRHAASFAMTPRLKEPRAGENPPKPQLTLGRRADLWVLARLNAVTASHGKGVSVAIVSGLMAVVGTLDFLAGVRISLSLFYLIPIVLSVTWLGWRAGCATAVASTVVRVSVDLANGGYLYPISAGWNRLIDLFVYLVVVLILHALVSLLREVDERVHQRTAALQQAIAERTRLQTELLEISQGERRAIGHDLHDGLGQHLTATSIAANLLANRLASGRHAAAEDAQNVVNMLHEAIGTTRKIARGLLLASVPPDELLPEIDGLAAAIQHENPIVCRFVHSGINTDMLSVPMASHLFYIAQEAARNAVRHAEATALDISLVDDGSSIELAVIDNGRGIGTANANSSGIGLRIMAHRTELLGGEFSIEPGADGGTAVHCRVPLLARPPAAPEI
jgi:signal transduction histidine kinase